MREIPSFLPRHKLAKQLGISISTIKRWEKTPSFPNPKICLFGKDYFNFLEIIEWMNQTNKGEKK